MNSLLYRSSRSVKVPSVAWTVFLCGGKERTYSIVLLELLKI